MGGWGLTRAENDWSNLWGLLWAKLIVPDRLLYAQLPLVSCGGPHEPRSSSREYICAEGSATSGICFGDSGGPLVCPVASEPNILLQFGVQAARKGLYCRSGVSLTMRVSTFIEWIRENAEDPPSTIPPYEVVTEV